MQTLGQMYQSAADGGPFRTYWLAFLLTGHREPSVHVAIQAIESEDGANSFFSTWMRAWSRRVVIAKALAAIRGELAASASRTAARHAEKTVLPPRNSALDPETARVQIERVLLAIDLFPRCALLLLVFERVSLEDAAILLDVNPNLVRKAQVIGLRELTSQLATMQGWKSALAGPLVASELQHA